MTSSAATKATFTPDQLDHKLFAAFPGLVMRKDLTQAIRGATKAPSYVIEFMLGKYCANLFDDDEVREGLQLVQQEVAEYIPRGDETEVVKSAIRERPPRRIIDLVKVELDEGIGSGVYWAAKCFQAVVASNSPSPFPSFGGWFFLYRIAVRSVAPQDPVPSTHGR